MNNADTHFDNQGSPNLDLNELMEFTTEEIDGHDVFRQQNVTLVNPETEEELTMILVIHTAVDQRDNKVVEVYEGDCPEVVGSSNGKVTHKIEYVKETQEAKIDTTSRIEMNMTKEKSRKGFTGKDFVKAVEQFVIQIQPYVSSYTIDFEEDDSCLDGCFLSIRNTIHLNTFSIMPSSVRDSEAPRPSLNSLIDNPQRQNNYLRKLFDKYKANITTEPSRILSRIQRACDVLFLDNEDEWEEDSFFSPMKLAALIC
ncbi:unnamed protein product [Moneuplotes crassus]|uniref:Uncharacterized protein n=1 Tax=Euplotes crassus TaxID=5936 RepID=A0AAD1XFY1_EUPCR|nr:unnamed protein product [Moneuplotes crassus]